MDFSQTAFETGIDIPEDVRVIFVSDFFIEDLVGGAELTSEALIQSSPFKLFKLHSKDVTMELLQKHQRKFWIFGNFANMNLNLIPAIMANLRYSVLEYDYKFCQFRSPEKHAEAAGECDCHGQMHGKLISSFYASAAHMWWMSEKQMEVYNEKFPFLRDQNSTVLSSVFAPMTLTLIKGLRERAKKANVERSGWIVLGSQSWVKGFENAKSYCEDNELDYEVVWNLPYEKVLGKLATAEGFVYLPNGNDTCPRMVIEAKLLGCKLVLNDHVQHKDEDWFNPEVKEGEEDDEITQIEQYLYAARDWFWNGIKAAMEFKPTISGYTTTRNCISQGYPYMQAINSMLEFCDQVVVVDCGSDDGTWEELTNKTLETDKLTLKRVDLDYNDSRFALFDGYSKALARSLCTSEFCWQQDSDEIVHEDDAEKIKDLVKRFPSNANLIALPVVEYWGGLDKVRADINPWKWRISRNFKEITHGVPKNLRVVSHDENSQFEYYAKQGTDGCDYVHAETGEVIPFANFYTGDVEMLRRSAVSGNEESLSNYAKWLNIAVSELPGVYHFSWFDIERKIHSFKGYWAKHWKALYDIDVEDTAENNVMFDVPWSEVSDEMIAERARELAEGTGGWIFHQKWDGTNIPHVQIHRNPPKFIADWVEERTK
jgi:glycosyltransferase involved in cell wall biosynthesis